MAKKLFIGNLNYRTTDETLFDAFSAIGNVESAAVITDRETGRSRGFGFVEMATEEDAQAAIQQLDNTDLDGRTIRVAEANRIRHDRAGRKLIKGAKWLLLRNKANLPDRESHVRLKEVLEANQALMTAYVLKDDLKQLWTYRREGWARRAWEGWLARAQESGIKPLIHFAKRLTVYLPGILAHCRWPLHTSLLEGINNKIKVLKRTAYGYRDDAYFFLKIRSAFPGNA